MGERHFYSHSVDAAGRMNEEPMDEEAGRVGPRKSVQITWASHKHLSTTAWSIHFRITGGDLTVVCDLYGPGTSTRQDWSELLEGRPVELCRGALVSDGTWVTLRMDEEGGDNDRVLQCAVPLASIEGDLRRVLSRVTELGMEFAEGGPPCREAVRCLHSPLCD